MKRWLIRIGAALGALGILALIGFSAASARAWARLGQRYETHAFALPMPPPSDVAAIERGRHLVASRYGCGGCHGVDLAGGTMLDQPAIGVLRGPNLTRGRGGRTSQYTMADWDRIVRHGVKRDGTAALMPSQDFFGMSDQELSDIVAFIRSAPAVDREVPASRLGPVGAVLLALGRLPLAAEQLRDHAAPHAGAPPETRDDLRFGAHLAAICTSCHRANLAGGPVPSGPPDWPDASNLTPHAEGLGSWSEDDFERALTRGVSRDGRPLREPMSAVVSGTRAMLPIERRALWTFLRSVAPSATNP